VTRLNLLPWREMRRKEQDRQLFSILIGAALLMALVLLYAYLHIGALVDTQVRRNEFMAQEVKRMDEEIKEVREIKKQRDDLLARMRVIQQLQQDRTEIVHLLDDLVRRLPEGVYLTSLKQSGRSFTLSGYAQSNARVSAFMRNLDGSEVFVNPDLDVINISARGNERVSQFTLRVSQRARPEKTEAPGT
jgi:type IV pilus assembly protein PilN